MKKTLALAVTAIALAVPTLSSAQFANPLSGLMGGKSSSDNASANMGAQQDSLVRTYVAAGNNVLTANVHMADALGVKAESIDAAAKSDSSRARTSRLRTKPSAHPARRSLRLRRQAPR